LSEVLFWNDIISGFISLLGTSQVILPTQERRNEIINEAPAE
jgi:hypothetical protein